MSRHKTDGSWPRIPRNQRAAIVRVPSRPLFQPRTRNVCVPMRRTRRSDDVLVLRIDGFAWMFAVLVPVIGKLV